MNLWIKICGNTTLEDVQLAADCGADAVGFVFAPSPRSVTPEQVAAIASHIPEHFEKIGVFVDATYEEIAKTVESAGLTGVQLHWDAPPDLPAQLRAKFGNSLRILRVVHLDAQETALQRSLVSRHNFSRADAAKKEEGALAFESDRSDPDADAILVDSRTASAAGGTGKAFDWSLAANTLFQNAKKRKLVVAGGLTPGNVAEAIATLQPWGVDVVSGVEAAPGRKDPAKVRTFIANARVAAGRC